MGQVELENVVEQMALIGRLLHSRGIFSARAGNISVRLADDSLLITRGGVHKALLDRSRLIRLDRSGAPLEQGRASSETQLHLAAYAAAPELGAVLHAHPPACTALAIRGLPLQPELTEEGPIVLGGAPLLDENADRAVVAAAWAEALRSGARAALLRGHGVVVAGKDLEDVLAKVELCEFIAELQHRLGLTLDPLKT